MNAPQRDHWLSRPRTVRGLWMTFVAVLVLVVLAQLVVEVEPHFGVDGWFGFGAVFGFASCAVMVIVARALGLVLKRRESYYDD